MNPDSSFDEFVQRLQAGDDDAAAKVFHRFAERLIALARSRLGNQIRGKVDAEDVLQSVYKSFFLRTAEGKFEIVDWDGLWALLVVITVRKCSRKRRTFNQAARAVSRERPYELFGDDADGSWQVLSREATPAEAVMLTDTLEHVMTGLDEQGRAIVALKLQGNTEAEISEHTGRSGRTVRRVLARIRKRLREVEESDEE